MPTGYQIKDQHALHYVTLQVVYWVDMIQEKIDYIYLNPVRSGIVAQPEEYLYSSARNYAGMEGVLNIILVSKLWKTYH